MTHPSSRATFSLDLIAGAAAARGEARSCSRWRRRFLEVERRLMSEAPRPLMAFISVQSRHLAVDQYHSTRLVCLGVSRSGTVPLASPTCTLPPDRAAV